jgi:F-type H+-transporting ATPase subunit b
LEFHPEDILISLINIAVLFILLRLILWKHVNRFLSARAGRVRSELDDIEKRRSDADALKAEYEEKIESIEAQGRDLIRESRVKASEEAEEILEDAREKARAMILEARERIEEEKERAVVNAQHEIAQLATNMAARILRREVSPDDSMSAVDHFFHDTGE